MRRFVLISFFVALVASASGQTLHFSDGRVVKMTPSVRIDKTTVSLPIDNAGSGEMSLPLSTLSRVDWPRPAELAAAETDLKEDRAEAALRKLDPLIASQQPLAEIPGSWWGQATLRRALALSRLNRETDVLVEIERLRRSPANAPLAIAAEISLASSLAETGKADQASAAIAKINRATLPDADLASLFLIDARILRAQGRHEEALLTCLRVPVLYPAQTALAPAALLLSSECYRSMDEPVRAAAARQALIERFPNSPEAARAKALNSDS